MKKIRVCDQVKIGAKLDEYCKLQRTVNGWLLIIVNLKECGNQFCEATYL